MSSETNLAIVMSESILITWQHYSKESQLFGMRRIRIGTELNLIKRHKRYFELLLCFEILWAKSYALIHINIVWTYRYLYTFQNKFDGGYPFYIICIVFEIISRQKNYKDFSLSMNKHYIPILMYANHFSGKFRIESIYQIMLLISSQGI